MPDSRLVARVRAGDERAFEVVYDRYHRQLLAFCRHMLGTREEAEDALQHVFVSAHRNLVADGGKVVELRPWLYAIARNRCLSVLRARREAVALDDVAEPSSDGLAVAAEVEQREDLKDTLGDLARLPDDQRAALVLSELGALSHDEVAAVLDVRRDKVKALVFQARESLAGWRQARNTDCREIREQLATLSGGALRRAPLRRHLDTCDSCREFRSEVRRQREAMALLLPVVPSIALKAKVFGAVAASHAMPAATVGGGAAAGLATASGAGGAASASSGFAALGGGFAGKALVVAAIAGTAGGGYAVVSEETAAPPVKSTPVERVVTPAGTTKAVPAGTDSLTDAVQDAARPGSRSRGHGKAKGKRTDDGRGRPAVPGAQGLDNAPSAQGLEHRPATPPGLGAKSDGKSQGAAHSGTRGSSQAHRRDTSARRTPAHPARPVRPTRPERPGRPVTPATDTSDDDTTTTTTTESSTDDGTTTTTSGDGTTTTTVTDTTAKVRPTKPVLPTE